MVQRCLLSNILLFLCFTFFIEVNLCEENGNHTYNKDYNEQLLKKIISWAPLVWLAPSEEFFPSSTESFLNHVHPWTPDNPVIVPEMLPTGPNSQSWFLITKYPIDTLLRNKTSIIYGERPENKKIFVPVYAQVKTCQNSLHFHVTYWLFFPYSQGKEVCTVDLGPFGPFPIPLLNGHCLGKMQEFGSHVGDWEHMSLYFKEEHKPTLMYISAHDTGAFYKFEHDSKRFLFQKQEIRLNDARMGALQRPTFPKIVNLISGSHPELFAAKGSHGLWAAPGKHKYVRLPRLYDESGFGTPWSTWKSIILLKETDSHWLKFWGRWGNPKSQCHPVVRNICQQFDGPTGIPMKKQHFKCS